MDDGASPDRSHAAPDRLLLVVSPGRNRELLVEWLDSFPAYAVTAVAPDEELPEYDVCVVHEDAIGDVGAALAARKRSADPVHLPHLLLSPEESEVGADWDVVDDVVALPVDKAALKRRVENLLQARRASLRLVEREDQYRQLVELTPEGILLVEDDTVIYANSAAVELLRAVGGADIEGEPLGALVHEDDEAAMAVVLSEVEEEGQPSSYTEMRFRTTRGTTVPASVAGVRVTYEGRPVTQLVVRDLTERKARERQLDLFGRAIESSAQGITIADAQQDDEPLVYANEAFERITGYGKDEVLGRNCRFLQGDHTDQGTVDEIRAAVEAREPVSVELLNYRRDGTPFWNRLDIVPVEDDGEVTHFLGLQRDITARKEREQRVAVLDRVLRHNLRNQTAVIRGYADLLVDHDRTVAGRDDRVAVADVAGQIGTAADELLEISEQVRRFRSVVTGEDRTLEEVDLAEVVRGAAEGFRPSGTVELSVPERAVVRADATLPAAVRDLFELAVEAEAPSIAVSVDVSDEDVTLALTDRGSAIPTEDLQVVDSEAETPLAHLQGVDLWLIRWSVEQSDGEFAVDVDGEHSVVTMRFPPV